MATRKKPTPLNTPEELEELEEMRISAEWNSPYGEFDPVETPHTPPETPSAPLSPPRISGFASFQTEVLGAPNSEHPRLVEDQVMALRRTADGVGPEDVRRLRAHLTEHCQNVQAWRAQYVSEGL